MFKLKLHYIQEFCEVDKELTYGFSQIIASPTGTPLKPFKYKQAQPIFKISPGIYIIQIFRYLNQYTIKIFKITSYHQNIAEIEFLASFTDLTNNPYKHLHNAILSAIDKSYCYKCKAPHYAL